MDVSAAQLGDLPAHNANISEGDEEKDTKMEESYKRHGNFVGQIKNQYGELYRQLVAKLSTSHLEPFEKTLLENEDSALQGKQQFIESMQKYVLTQLLRAFENFWEDFDVTNSLTTLEILKEKYKDFEGTEWKVENKSPNERKLPARIYYKLALDRCLNKHLQYQSKEYEEVLQKNKNLRACIHDISQKRIYLRKTMELNTELIERVKPQLLLNDDENNENMHTDS